MNFTRLPFIDDDYVLTMGMIYSLFLCSWTYCRTIRYVFFQKASWICCILSIQSAYNFQNVSWSEKKTGCQIFDIRFLLRIHYIRRFLLIFNYDVELESNAPAINWKKPLSFQSNYLRTLKKGRKKFLDGHWSGRSSLSI